VVSAQIWHSLYICMHHLHTTRALVIGSYPRGESNRMYRFFTEDFGILYAHGQGVRELRNRNRFALRTATFSYVTLVRGRDIWRVTGASTLKEYPEVLPAEYRPIIALVGRLLATEVASPSLFTLLSKSVRAWCDEDTNRIPAIESLTVLRMLHELGYVARSATTAEITPFLIDDDFTGDLLERAKSCRSVLIAHINSALIAANG
jgi:recombinational DNA repair protein (RecF pathway)